MKNLTNMIAVLVLAVGALAGVATIGLMQSETADAQTTYSLDLDVTRDTVSYASHTFPYHTVSWRHIPGASFYLVKRWTIGNRQGPCDKFGAGVTRSTPDRVMTFGRMTGSDFYWTFDQYRYFYEVKAYSYEDREAKNIATASGCMDDTDFFPRGQTTFSLSTLETSQSTLETSQSTEETSSSTLETSTSTLESTESSGVDGDASFALLTSRPSAWANKSKQSCNETSWNNNEDHRYLEVVFDEKPAISGFAAIRDSTFDVTNGFVCGAIRKTSDSMQWYLAIEPDDSQDATTVSYRYGSGSFTISGD